jgi:hypothetical protein
VPWRPFIVRRHPSVLIEVHPIGPLDDPFNAGLGWGIILQANPAGLSSPRSRRYRGRLPREEAGMPDADERGPLIAVRRAWACCRPCHIPVAAGRGEWDSPTPFAMPGFHLGHSRVPPQRPGARAHGPHAGLPSRAAEASLHRLVRGGGLPPTPAAHQPPNRFGGGAQVATRTELTDDNVVDSALEASLAHWRKRAL